MWIAWYLGWATLLLGMTGLALIVYVVVARGQWSWLGLLLPLAVPGLLYVVRVSILPDQIWAMRRLVIGAVPLVVAAAALALRHLASRNTTARSLSLVTAVALVLWPLTTWSGLFTVRDRVGQMDEAKAVCGVITDGRVLLVGAQPGGMDYTATLRVLCDSEVVRLRGGTPEDIAAIRSAWGGTPLTLLTFDRQAVVWSGEPGPLLTKRVEEWEMSLSRPDSSGSRERSLYGGVVESGGTVSPLGSPVEPARNAAEDSPT